jgi:hypothetical protein
MRLEAAADVDDLAAVPREAHGRTTLVDLWRPAGMFVASRALASFAFVAASAARPQFGFRSLTSRWDGGYYLSIIGNWYPDYVRGKSVYAFFPAFPLTARALTHLPGMSSYRAATLVVFVSAIVATCLLWLLTRDIYDIDAADRATALFVFAPGAFVLSMVYAEAFFLCFAIGACWALVRRQWVLAGLLGAVTTATRPNGLAIVVAAVAAVGLEYRRREARASAVLAPVIALCGFAATHLYFWARTSRANAWFAAERAWHEQTNFGTGRWDDLVHLMVRNGSRPDWNHVVPTVGLVLFAVLFVVSLRVRPRMPAALVAFALGIAFFAIAAQTLGLRPRFVSSAFPLFIGLGVALRRAVPFAIVVAVSACLMVMLVFVTSTTNYLTP